MCVEAVLFSSKQLREPKKGTKSHNLTKEHGSLFKTMKKKKWKRSLYDL